MVDIEFDNGAANDLQIRIAPSIVSQIIFGIFNILNSTNINIDTSPFSGFNVNSFKPIIMNP